MLQMYWLFFDRGEVLLSDEQMIFHNFVCTDFFSGAFIFAKCCAECIRE